ncbi:glycosyltransferase family 4 protein [Alicyclobacillus curvatus]|nr:glycosyltransferase family 4 protein [Alicyclobacillus curvatus]
MNILLATMFSYPQKGGLGSYVKELAKALRNQGHTVDIFACHPSFTGYYLVNGPKMIETQAIRSSEFYRWHPQFAGDTSKLDWTTARELERYTFELAALQLDLKKYDLIHTQDVVSTRVMAEMIGYRTPVVQTVHGSVTHQIMMEQGAAVKTTDVWKYACHMEWLGVQLSRVSIVPSKWLMNVMRENSGVPLEHLKVVPNAINVEEFLGAMKLSNLEVHQLSRNIITCIGHLTEMKGQRYLIQALGQLSQSRRDWTCWLVGDGTDRPVLEHLCRELDIENRVRFLGHREDIPAVLKRTDIFVLPTLTENYPYSIIEAQAVGTAIIASNVGGVPEVLEDGVTGLLVPPGDVNHLSDALRRLLDDQALRYRLGKNCTELRGEKLSIATMMQEVTSVYELALEDVI